MIISFWPNQWGEEEKKMQDKESFYQVLDQ